MGMTKALVKAFVGSLVGPSPRHTGGRAPYHWHVQLYKKKYMMERIGFNQRTRKHVYQCPFCGGKAERPF